MDGLPDNAQILNSLIAPARYSDGPTLFLICQVDDQCVIYEQMPDGMCQAWPEALVGGAQQAECMISQRMKSWIIHASKNFVTKLKCSVSLSKHRPTHVQAFDEWTGDLLKVKQREMAAVMMHNNSLAAVIVPLRGIRSFEEFLPLFLRKVNQLLKTFGASIDEANQNVLVLRRTNRPVIGSLNDAKELIEFEVIEQLDIRQPLDWNKAAEFINRTPFSLIDQKTPSEALASLISEQSK